MNKIKLILIMLTILIINTILYTSSFAVTKYRVDNTLYTYTDRDVSLKYNNENMEFDIPPIIHNDRTLLPIRALVEKVNGKVGWEESTKKVTIELNDLNIEMNIDNKIAKVNGKEVVLDVAPCLAYKDGDLYNERTLVPVRFVMENLGLEVDWDEDTYTVLVDKKDNENPNEVDKTNIITKVAYTAANNVLTIKINATNEIEYKVSDYTGPDRTVIDILNSKYDCNTNDQTINKGVIDKLRMGTGEDYSRIVVDLLEKTDYTYSLSNDKKELTITYKYTEKNVKDIGITDNSNSCNINIKGVNIGKYDIRRLTDPEKIQVILYDMRPETETLIKEIEVSNKYVNKIVTEKYTTSGVTNTRVTIYLKDQYEYSFNKTSTLGVINISDKTFKNMVYSNQNDTSYNLNFTLNKTIEESNISYSLDRVNKKYILNIPYEYGDFNQGSLKIGDNNIENITITKDDSKKVTTIVIKYYQQRHFKINIEDKKLNINILRRDPNRKFIVVIDPGHGGKGPGAVYEGVKEMDINLQVADKLIKLLKQNPNIEVYSTQEAEKKIALKDIANFANDLEADLFVSIHSNAATDSNGNTLISVSGTETYYPVRESDSEYGITSRKLAEFIQNNVVKELGNNNRGVKERGTLAVLKYTNMPACLCELDFMSCPEALKKLASDEYQQKYAQAIYNGIVEAVEYMK